MGQYFAFKRHQGEQISSFLIHEALHYEEFRECLVFLKEEQTGMGPEQNGFGIPDEVDEDDEVQDQASEADETGACPAPKPKSRPAEETILSMSDSFILEQLRGWHLLTSASLTSEEWRAVFKPHRASLTTSPSAMPCRSSMMSKWFQLRGILLATFMNKIGMMLSGRPGHQRLMTGMMMVPGIILWRMKTGGGIKEKMSRKPWTTSSLLRPTHQVQPQKLRLITFSKNNAPGVKLTRHPQWFRQDVLLHLRQH